MCPFSHRLQYLGKAIGTIRKLSDLNMITARVDLDTAGSLRRVFSQEDLNACVDSLKPWYDSPHGEILLPLKDLDFEIQCTLRSPEPLAVLGVRQPPNLPASGTGSFEAHERRGTRDSHTSPQRGQSLWKP